MVSQDNKKNFWSAIILLVIGLGVISFHPLTVHAELINATGEFGQYNATTSPDAASLNYDQSNSNSNLSAVNGLGLNEPYDSAIDTTHHRLFVADAGDNRILIFQLDDNDDLPSSTASAAYVLGQPDFISSNSTSTQSGLNFPSGVTYDSATQRLFVADTNNNRVMVFDVSTATITNGENAEDVIGQPDFFANNATTTQNGLSSPRSVTYDSVAQRLFVSDTADNRVMVFPAGTSTIATSNENATDVIGQADFISMAGSGVNLTGPQGLSYDSVTQRLFIADHDDSRVMVFNVATSTILTTSTPPTDVIGQSSYYSGSPNDTQNGLNNPTDVAYDPVTQRLFVGDSSNNRVMVFAAGTSTITSSNENATDVIGQASFTANNSAAAQNGFNSPYGVIYDSTTQRIFVSDYGNNRIMIFPADTSIATSSENAVGEIGQYNSWYVPTGAPQYTNNTINAGVGSTNSFGLSSPYYDSLDSVNHRLFVADTANNRVLVFPLDNNDDIPTSSQQASYVLGQSNFTANGGAVTQNGLNQPYGLTYDPSTQRLFVADIGSNRVVVFNVSTSTITNGENATDVIGQPNFTSGNATTSQSGLNQPYGLAYDSVAQRLFVADGANNRVMIFAAGTSTIATSSEMATDVIGQPDFISNTAAETQNGLSSPHALTYDSDNQRLFVSDQYHNRVMVFPAGTSTIATSSEMATDVIGQSDFTSDSGAITQSGFSLPEGVNYDSEYNRLFVADYGNNRVLVFPAGINTLATSSEMATDVIGQADFTSNGNSATQDGLYHPYNFIYDSTNQHLFVADTGNNRIMEFPIIAPAIISLSTSTLSSSVTVGASSSTQNIFLTNTGSSTLNWTSALSASSSWFTTLTSSSGTLAASASTTLSFVIDPSSLATGSYNATTTISDPNASNSPQTISITLTVNAASSGGGGGGGSVVTVASGGGSSPDNASSLNTSPIPSLPPSSPPTSTPTTTSNNSSSAISLQATLAQLESEYQSLTAQEEKNSSSSSTCTNLFTTNLEFGMQGAEVKELQQFMNDHGFPLGITGAGSPNNETIFFVGRTRTAVVNYQKANHIIPDIGFFGPITRTSVNVALCKEGAQ